MNYEKNYYDYINYIKTKDRKKNKNIYYESHHILPRSLGGNDNLDNLVLLTAREHFLAHFLLFKFNYCKETLNAFIMMQNRGKYNSSRLYSNSKVLFAKHISEWNKTRVKTKEEIEKTASWHRGKKRSKETCEKISNSLKGKDTWSKGKKFPYKARPKQAQTLKENWNTDPRKFLLKKPAKKIFCIELNTVFLSAKNASIELNYPLSRIRHSCKKNGELRGKNIKYHFIYYDSDSSKTFVKQVSVISK